MQLPTTTTSKSEHFAGELPLWEGVEAPFKQRDDDPMTLPLAISYHLPHCFEKCKGEALMQ